MVAKVKVKSADAEIFQPDDMEKLLLAAPDILIPYLAIGAFAGLRGAELSRLDWSAANLECRIIQLRAGQAKTASRRIVPMSDNLVAWLSLVQDREGPVMTQQAVGADHHPDWIPISTTGPVTPAATGYSTFTFASPPARRGRGTLSSW